MAELILVALSAILAINTVIFLRLVRDELRYRRAVRRRLNELRAQR
jgi:hypothetical protein